MINGTPRQNDLLRFLKGHIAAKGFSPSYTEMMDGMGVKSKSGIARLLDGLEARGLIRRLPAQARAIEIVADLPIPRSPDGEPLHMVRGPWSKGGCL